MNLIDSLQSYIEYILFFLFTTLKALKTECSVVKGIVEFVHPFKIFTIFPSPVIRQKRESQSGCFKKTKRAKFFEKRTFLTS